MGSLERLTYLLGICVAVIGWGVTQLSNQITADDVIAYTISSGAEGPSQRYMTIYLENLSKSHSPDSIAISLNADKKGCVKSFNYEHGTFSLPIQIDAAVDPQRQGAERILVPEMPPGSSFSARAVYSASCDVSPTLDLKSEDSTHVRLLERGLETFVIRNQFGILLFLVSAFALVFAATFALSYRAATKGT